MRASASNAWVRSGLPWTLLFSSCVSVEELTLPDVGDARTLIVTRETERGIAAEVVALDDVALPWARTFEPGAALSVVALGEPVESLQLLEGALSFQPIDHARRVLPAPLGAWARAGDVWAPRDAPDALVTLRLAEFDFERCATAGGCLASAPGITGEETEICKLPCDADTPELPIAPAPPRPAASPALPCPSGWSEVASAPPHCEAPPLPAATTCTTGQVQPFRAAACEPLGAPCPMGQWPETLPDGAIFVSPDAAPGGTGTRSDPMPLPQALSIAPAGAVIALSAGRFEGELDVRRDVTITGACAAATELTSTGGHVLQVSGARVWIADLHLRGGRASLRVAGATTELVADGVAIEASDWGVEALDGARVSLDRVTIRDFGGAGLVANGAEVSLTDVVIERGRGLGILSLGTGASVSAERVAIRDVAPSASNEGSGIVVDASSLDGRGISIERCGDVGLLVSAAASAVVDGLEVAEVGSGSDDAGGFGVLVDARSHATLAHVRITRTMDRGLFVVGPSATATLTDAIVRTAADVWAGSFGVDVLNGARATIARVWIEDARQGGLVVSGGSAAEIEDLVVRSTRAISGGDEGSGVTIRESSTATITRLDVADCVGSGVRVTGARAALVDAKVDGTLPAESMRGGFGIATEPLPGSPTIGATLTVDRGHVSNSRNSGILVGAGVTATLRDVVVRDTEPEAFDGGGGIGILCQDHSRTKIERADVERSWAAGVMVWRFGRLDVEDLGVRATREELGDGIGHAVYVDDQASLRLTRAELRDSAKASVWVRSAMATVEDLRTAGAGADGIGADYDGRLSVTRAVLDDSSACAVHARDRSALVVRDVTARGTTRTGLGALCVMDEAHASMERFELSGGAGSGLYVYGTLGDPLSAVASLTNGTISGFPNGATLVGGQHELRTIFERVRFTNNGRALLLE